MHRRQRSPVGKRQTRIPESLEFCWPPILSVPNPLPEPLQQPAEDTWNKNTAWEGPRGEERVSVAMEDMCEGVTPFPARLGRASGLVGNSRHWAFWLAIYVPLEMLHVIGVPVSQVQGQGPLNFIMRLESISGISRIISLYFQEPPSSGQRNCGKRIESAPLPGGPRNAP